MNIYFAKNNPIKLKKYSFKEYMDITIFDNNDNLKNINAYDIKGINYYYSINNPPYNQIIPGSIKEVLLREIILKKLSNINKTLNESNLELFIMDGLRPLSVQVYIYNEWLPAFYKKNYPQLTYKEIDNIISKYWVRPPNSLSDVTRKNTPPHSTGGAVDLTIRCKQTKRLLEMGTIFDDLSEKAHIDFFEKDNRMDSFTSLEAKNNRRLLFNLMLSEGFAYHPFEWWHYSYGDQMWANQYNKSIAIFGAVY